MSAKRKDKKGRILRTGESQRKDLTYQYRYTDSKGKRHTVYAPTLDGLRNKEKEINSTENAGAGCNDGGITVIELLERYISLKQGALGMLCNALLRIERSRTLTTVWMGIAASCFWTKQCRNITGYPPTKFQKVKLFNS